MTHEQKLNRIRAMHEFTALQLKRQRQLKILDRMLGMAALGMLIATLYVVHGG